MTLLFVFLTFQFLFWPCQCQIKFCAKSCPVNEVYLSDVSQCHNTCFNQDFNSTFKCATAPGCVCKENFIRDQETYTCIPTNKCSIRRGSKHCPSNEFFSNTEGNCFKTCQNRNVKFKCPQVSGCTCRTGYLRSDVTFQCIPESYCSSS